MRVNKCVCVVIKESVLDVILYNIVIEKENWEDRNHSHP
jgi:hypothetical protein